jgi:hypothetical protein
VGRAGSSLTAPFNLHHHFVQAPPTGRTIATATNIAGDLRAELVDPTTDRFAAGFNPSLHQEFFDVSETQGEAKI